MTKESDELADTLYGKLINLGFAKPGGTFVRTEIRTLAREAEAMGVKKALEDAAQAAFRNEVITGPTSTAGMVTFTMPAGDFRNASHGEVFARWLKARAEQIGAGE